MVALTFDDGPDPVWTPPVLDALDAAGVKATFFVVAEQIEASGGGELLAETMRRGHAIQLHCSGHVRHESLSLERLRADRDHLEDVLSQHGVPAPALWRPPYGSVHVPHSCRAAAERDRQLIRWTYDPRDYRGSSAASMLAAAQQAPLSEDSVVLLHDSRRYSSTPRGGAGETVALIGPLVEHVHSTGCELGALTRRLDAPASGDGGSFLLPCGGEGGAPAASG